MQTTADFIPLPYTPDLSQAGIAYACRSLPYTYNRMGGSPYDRLRRIVAGKAVELAFRRFLGSRHVSYDLLGLTPFTDPDQYDVAIGGRECDLKSFLIFQKDKIRRMRKDPACLLEASALVPSDQLTSEKLSDRDLYIFAFLYALIATSAGPVEKALLAGQPVYMLHSMPASWASPSPWAPLGRLSLKSDLDVPVKVELGGQDAHRSFITEEILLKPHAKMDVRKDFYTMAYLHSNEVLEGRIAVHSPRLDQVYLIPPDGWGNIWIYGLEVLLVGYMERGEFRSKSHYLPPRSRVLQYPYTRAANHALPIHQLHSIQGLIRSALEWQGGLTAS